MSEATDRVRRAQGVGLPPAMWTDPGGDVEVMMCSRGRPMTEEQWSASRRLAEAAVEMMRREMAAEEHGLQIMAALAGSLGDGRMIVSGGGQRCARYRLAPA